MALQLLVVTPERKVVETEADEVELPGAHGIRRASCPATRR